MARLGRSRAACPWGAPCINGREDFITPRETDSFIEHDADHAAKVLQLLLENRDLRKTMGNSALKLVRAHYTWDRVAEMTEDAYFEYLEHYPADNSAN